MASEAFRSRAGRELAEHALATFGVRLGEHAQRVVVIGGLNPDFLAADPPVAHQGTTDVDLLLEVALVYDREEQDFSWLEEALASSGFRPRVPDNAWRWELAIGGALVVLDLLCDIPDNLGQSIALPGCREATAMNLSGPGPAAVDSIERTIAVPPAVQAELPAPRSEVRLRFAGLGGYLLAKASAVLRRGLAKDYYDFAFVLAFSKVGATGIVEAVRAALVPPSYTHDALADLRAVLDNFAEPDPAARAVFVTELVASGAEIDADLLAEDLRTIAERCLRALTDR